MNFRIIIIGWLLIESLGSVAQNSTDSKTRFQFGFYFSADQSYRYLNSDSSNFKIKRWRNYHEKPGYGYTTGLSCLFHMSRKADIETGFHFSQKSIHLNEIFLYFGDYDDIDPRISGFIDTSNPSLMAVGFDYKYHYLNIPFKLNYIFIDDELKISALFGMSTDIFLNQKVITYNRYTNGTLETKSTSKTYYLLNPIDFSILIGLGVLFKISESFSLKVEPIYRRSIKSFDNDIITSYLYSYGFGMTLYGL